jgi:hypothetical protein
VPFCTGDSMRLMALRTTPERGFGVVWRGGRGSLFAADNDPERHNWDTALQCWAAFVGCVGALFPRPRGRIGFAQGSAGSAARRVLWGGASEFGCLATAVPGCVAIGANTTLWS